MSSETFTRLFKECDPPAPSIMEGFLLCNEDETLAIVEPTGATIAVSEAHRNGLHKEPWNNGGAGGQYPLSRQYPLVNTTLGKNCSYPEKSVSSPQTACHRHENVLLLISICMIKKQ